MLKIMLMLSFGTLPILIILVNLFYLLVFRRCSLLDAILDLVKRPLAIWMIFALGRSFAVLGREIRALRSKRHDHGVFSCIFYTSTTNVILSKSFGTMNIHTTPHRSTCSTIHKLARVSIRAIEIAFAGEYTCIRLYFMLMVNTYSSGAKLLS